MGGTFIYLNSNSYTKDNNYRCYVTCADGNGNVMSFNASGISQDLLPKNAFDIVHIDFDVNQFGNNQMSFVMKAIKITGKMVDTDKK